MWSGSHVSLPKTNVGTPTSSALREAPELQIVHGGSKVTATLHQAVILTSSGGTNHGTTKAGGHCAVGVILLGPTSAFAQQEAATLTGEVRDASGAVVPGAAVTVTNIGTNISVATVTNDRGALHRSRICGPGITP